MTDERPHQPPAESTWSDPIDCERLSELITAPAPSSRVVQEHCPIHESVEWKLSRQYWASKGLAAFVSGDVPYVVNNDGRLSADAAAIFLDQVQQSQTGRSTSDLFVLELGAGSGLFAKQFLDQVKRRSQQQGWDYYDRTKYVLTDGSHAMLEQLSSSGLFGEHADHLVIAHVQAPDVQAEIQALVDGNRLHAVFLNYVLDSLPFTYLYLDGDQTYQLLVQTAIDEDMDIPGAYSVGIEDIRAALSADLGGAAKSFPDIYRSFLINAKYEPIARDAQPMPMAIPETSEDPRLFLHNFGALQCLDELLPMLDDEGFILLNDYGIAVSENHVLEYQHFSGSIANGLNFSQLDGFYHAHDRYEISAPEVSSEDIMSRLIAPSAAVAARKTFLSAFHGDRLQELKKPTAEARALIETEQYEAARWKYREALESQPLNWVLLEEIASFLMYKLDERPRAVEIARDALKINPLATGLWNLLGDAAFYEQQYEEAERTYRHTIDLNEFEVRGRLNLAWVYQEEGRLDRALIMIAEAFGADRTGEYRELLLAKQGQLLEKMSHRYRTDMERQINRFRQHRAVPGRNRSR